MSLHGADILRMLKHLMEQDAIQRARTAAHMNARIRAQAASAAEQAARLAREHADPRNFIGRGAKGEPIYEVKAEVTATELNALTDPPSTP